MKCERCGAWTEVLETRETANGIPKRRRACANGHRFFSYEIHASVYSKARHQFAVAFRRIARQVALWRRDRKIAEDQRTNRDVAADHGLHPSVVSRIRARMRKELSP